MVGFRGNQRTTHSQCWTSPIQRCLPYETCSVCVAKIMVGFTINETQTIHIYDISLRTFLRQRNDLFERQKSSNKTIKG